MAEIRLDARLTRPGALVAGVVDGRVVLVRMLRDAAGADGWLAAHATGLPVPAVEPARCAERPALVVEMTAGEPLGGATPAAIRAQAAPLGRSLAAHGIAARLLRAADLAVRDGALVVRVPVEGAAEDAEVEANALAATVEAACAGAAGTPPRRAPRRAQALLAVACAMLAVVLGLAHGPGSPARAPRTPAAQAAPRPLPSTADPAPGPAATAAPSRRPGAVPARRRRHRSPHRRRRVRHRRPPASSRRVTPRRALRPAPPIAPLHGHQGGIAPAGGTADPVPVL